MNMNNHLCESWTKLEKNLKVEELKRFYEMSYQENDIPPRFYLAIHLSFHDDRGETTINNLLKGELEGVKGIGGTNMKNMIIDWGNMRELLIVMPSKELLAINKVSRVMYDNPEYLLSKGMKALRRLFNDTNETYTSIFSKMQKYLLDGMDDLKARSIILYNGTINDLDHDMKNVNSVNTPKDMVRIIMKKCQENEYLKELDAKWWFNVVHHGITKMGKLYSNEKEWLIKDTSIKIPRGSRIYAVIPSHYKKEYDNLHSGDKGREFFADEKAAESYVKWMDGLRKLRTKWPVEVVDEKYVDTKKYSLIKKRQES